MTCIVGLVHEGEVWMGADSAAVDVESLATTARSDTKLFRQGPLLIGWCGSFRVGQLLQYALEVPPHPAGMDVMPWMVTRLVDAVRRCLAAGGARWVEDGVEELTETEVLVGYRGRLFHLYEDYQVQEARLGFDACGCGEPYAVGSLFSSTSARKYPSRRVHLALRAAAEFSGGVLPPFHVDHLPASETERSHARRRGSGRRR